MIKTSFRSILGTAVLCLCAPAQAQLINGSFEINGISGETFLGWDEFGGVSASTELATDGARTARIEAPQNGGWDLAGVLQGIALSPGGYVRVNVESGFTGADPLVGQTRSLVNVEWRAGNGDLIGYESLTSSMSCDTPDTVYSFERIAGPAPPGTAEARLLLGAFSTPADQPGVVHFDEAEMVEITPPTKGEIQWNDFGGRTIEWSGYTWRVKRGGYFGPGNNLFADADDAVWVDAQGRLHMKIIERDGQWYSTELALVDPLGYGDHVFSVVGKIDEVDINTVLGAFTWEYQLSYTGIESTNLANEFDIEFSRWKNPQNEIAQFLPQPWQAGHISRYEFSPPSDDTITTHAFNMQETFVDCRAWWGDALDPAPGDIIHTWYYTGEHIPDDETPRVHLNFWMIEEPPTDLQEKEFVFDSFRFIGEPCSPADVTTAGAGAGDPGFGTPDGQVTGADIQYYVNAWVALDPAVADVTTTGAGEGEPGYGVPDGAVTGADIQYYVNLWVAGCP
jgi:hypothetical protein